MDPFRKLCGSSKSWNEQWRRKSVCRANSVQTCIDDHVLELGGVGQKSTGANSHAMWSIRYSQQSHHAKVKKFCAYQPHGGPRPLRIQGESAGVATWRHFDPSNVPTAQLLHKTSGLVHDLGIMLICSYLASRKVK